VAFLVLRPWLPPDAWKAAGALAGTWIGGSANLIAVGTTLGLSAELQGVVIIVDTVVGYTWMGLLISFAAHQDRFDRWIGADRSVVEGVGARLAERKARGSRPIAVADATLMVGLALVLTAACLWAGAQLPPVGRVLNAFSWAIILLTTIALLPRSRRSRAWRRPGPPPSATPASTAARVGGAPGNLRRVASPQFVLFGVIVSWSTPS
jgi:uncharacterized membrane protein